MKSSRSICAGSAQAAQASTCARNARASTPQRGPQHDPPCPHQPLSHRNQRLHHHRHRHGHVHRRQHRSRYHADRQSTDRRRLGSDHRQCAHPASRQPQHLRPDPVGRLFAGCRLRPCIVADRQRTPCRHRARCACHRERPGPGTAATARRPGGSTAIDCFRCTGSRNCPQRTSHRGLESVRSSHSSPLRHSPCSSHGSGCQRSGAGCRAVRCTPS